MDNFNFEPRDTSRKFVHQINPASSIDVAIMDDINIDDYSRVR